MPGPSQADKLLLSQPHHRVPSFLPGLVRAGGDHTGGHWPQPRYKCPPLSGLFHPLACPSSGLGVVLVMPMQAVAGAMSRKLRANCARIRGPASDQSSSRAPHQLPVPVSHRACHIVQLSPPTLTSQRFSDVLHTNDGRTWLAETCHILDRRCL